VAGELAFSRMQSTPFRWWFLPSWLGLDAPCVVSTWTWAVSRHVDAALSFRPAAALFLTVWSIYLGDRLIDVARCNDWREATGRLRFGRRYRPLFLTCLGLCLGELVVLLWTGLPSEVIWRGMYVALGLVVHFLLFVVPALSREKLAGKEFGVGLFFALGAYACLGYAPGMTPLLISVALLIAFNCLVIAARDTESDRANDPGGASQWWRTMQRDLLWAGIGLTITFGLAATLTTAVSFYSAVALAFFSLTALHRCSRRVSGDAVRALADFALFTPVLVEAVRLAGRVRG
jgi:hypothetical protein